MNTPSCNETGARGLPPWLAGALLKRGDLAPRFVYWRHRLAQQSRGWRRRLRRQLAVGVTGAALLLAVAGTQAQIGPTATDNAITVVNGQVGIAANGQCSLMEAIQNANNKTNGRPYTDCAAGNPNGADTINLPANGLFTINNAFLPDALVGPIGLPWISTAVTINGNGSTIQRGNNAPDFRVMAVGYQGNLTLNNTTVRNGYFYIPENDAAGGGGILNQGTLTITGSTISDNGASAYSIYGGGIHNTGQLTITASTIRNNWCSGSQGCRGGGIASSGSYNSLTLLGSTISGNQAFGQNGASGGGVMAGGELTISDSTFHDNTVDSWYWASGSALMSYGSASITGTTFDANISNTHDYEDHGSAITNGGDMTIANSTISNNQGEYYDFNNEGVTNEPEGYLTITNSTVTGNAGGIRVVCDYYSGDTHTYLHRTLVSGNGVEVQKYGDGMCFNQVFVNSHNLFGQNGNPGVSGFNPGPTDIVPTVGLNAILSPLANNGGPTQTHALPAGSPALDRAPNASCTAAPVNGLDQRAQPRNQNGSGSASSNECDVGAFERAGSATPVGAFYLSTAKAGTVGGVAFAPADIIKYDPVAGWSLYFDGSDVGITKNVTAFELQADGSILLSLVATQTVPGAGSVQPQDILRFTPTATGPNTAGTFQLWVDGSNVGLTTAAEKIDALGLAADGRIAISTTGAAAVAGPGGATLQAADEDALGFNRASATWSALLDFTALAGMGPEDVNALWINPTTGEVYVSLASAFNLGGVAGDAKDIVKLTPNGGGYTPSLYWDGSAAGFPAIIDGLEIVN